MAHSPAKPPRPPSTSRRMVRLTCGLIRSTRLSPASMSTPASRYVTPAISLLVASAVPVLPGADIVDGRRSKALDEALQQPIELVGRLRHLGEADPARPRGHRAPQLPGATAAHEAAQRLPGG